VTDYLDNPENAVDALGGILRGELNSKAGIGPDEWEKVEEKFYIRSGKARGEEPDFNKIGELIDECEHQYSAELSKTRSYFNEIEKPSRVDPVEEEQVTSDITKAEQLLIQREIKNSDRDRMVVRVDDTVATEELFAATENIYEEDGKKAFLISDQKTWQGRIAVEINETKRKFTLFKAFEKENDGATWTVFQHFGQKKPVKGKAPLDEFSRAFYQYKFVAGDTEYLALSPDKLDTERVELHGTHVEINDYITVGENRKLPNKQDIIFVHSVEPAIEPLTRPEIEGARDGRGREWFMDNFFGVYRHPEWFEDFVLALLSVNEDYDGYPSHLLWLADPDTGKSTFLECALRAFQEPSKEPFEGGGSTIKGLIPSFKSNPPREGVLLQSQRVCGIDEKFNLLANTIQSDNAKMQDAFRPMNSLLEHKKRKFESGNGSITGKMESTMLAATNDAYGMDDLMTAQAKLDTAYLSRFIQYQQLPSHVEFIDEQQSQIDTPYEEGLPERNDKWLSIMDTLREEVRVDVDSQRIADMHEDLSAMVPAGFQDTFRARHKHHIKVVVGGIAKLRYFWQNRPEFEARDQDYEYAREIWELIISSWGDVDTENMSPGALKRTLPDVARRAYEVIDTDPGITADELVKLHDFRASAITELRTSNLVARTETDEGKTRFYPHWTEEFAEIEENELFT